MLCRSPRRRAALSLFLGLVIAAPLGAQTPLHRRIDEAIAKKYQGPLAKPARDEELLRRLHLSLTGTIPSAADARQYLADKSPDKKARLIDRLLSGPEFPRRMQEFVHVMLEERRDTKDVALADWEDYLLKSFAANKPWNQLAREILAADPTDEKARAAARFYLDRTGDIHLITKDVGRLFLGRDIECARCHDHPTVKDYTQADYYGLYAFLHRSFIHRKGKDVLLAEKFQPGKVDFESVFFMKKEQIGPRLPGLKEIDEPAFPKGQEYVEAPNPKAGQAGTPKFRPRQLLASQMTEAAKTSPFVRNSANRLWFLMMGRGVVHPLDLHHNENLPFHPQLLDVLAEGLVECRFDIRVFLREIALTQAYQRSSLLPSESAHIPEGTFAVAELQPLSPEQLLYSMARATGLWDRLFEEAEKKLKKDDPKNFDAKKVDPLWRGGILRQEFASPLKAAIIAFGSRAGEPETEFQPSLAGALYLANEKLIQGWLKPDENNLIGRLDKMKQAAEVADELYLSVLSRFPSAEEKAEVADHLQKRGERRVLALQELAWALLASAEFRLNH